MKEKIEDIVLRHSARGMNMLRKVMPENYAEKTARMILSWEKGTVLLATGFFVAGYAETDGPAGTLFLALALKKLGYRPLIVSDYFTKGFFESEGIETVYMPIDEGEEWCENLLQNYNLVGMISIERCGKNTENQYANMRGVSISEHTAKIDGLFELAYGKIPTIGVGDGGNEIGMGNEAEFIAKNLALKPCAVKVTQLVIATVSNWGAYAIIAYLNKISGMNVFMSFEDVFKFISRTVQIGSVDGVLKERTVSVDGFGMDVEKEIIEALEQEIL